MSDIKLFKLTEKIEEIQGESVKLEKSLQTIIENNMDTFLGVKFLATEYSTGKNHGGRIDSLGIDENFCPVIIEYKRAVNENVINQGLFYLDWLMDHKAEFKLLTMERLKDWKINGKVFDISDIEWGSPRLICIAGDFTKYDLYAVKQMDRNIDLIKYKKYGEELLLLDMVHTNTESKGISEGASRVKKNNEKTVEEYLADASEELSDRYHMLRDFIINLGDDIQEKTLKHYIAFKRIKNFACIEIHPKSNAILVYLKVNLEEVVFKEGFSRDVTNIGHFGTGNFEIRFTEDKQFDEIQKYIIESYERN